jgi:hypothetical protein
MSAPRQTDYDGSQFRSRLEAKWAAFFTAWGTPYEYEPERYGPGKRGYLPDFWLPRLNLFWEIKPAGRFMTDAPDILKARASDKHMPAPLWIVYGEPLPERYVIEDEGCQFVLAHCRRCHGLSYVWAHGPDIASAWRFAREMVGWGDIGTHTCRDHDRHPLLDGETALTDAYRNGQKIWRYF